MPRNPNAKQANFVVDEDVLGRLEKSDNKSRDINEALRRFFGLPAHQLTLEDIRRVVRQEMAQAKPENRKGKHVCDVDCYVCKCPQCKEMMLNLELDRRECGSCFFVFDGKALEQAYSEKLAHIAEVDDQHARGVKLTHDHLCLTCDDITGTGNADTCEFNEDHRFEQCKDCIDEGRDPG